MSKRPITALSIAVPATKGAAYVPESAGTETLRSPQPTPPDAPALPLSPAASAALRVHQFKTGRAKQAIVQEALDQWLERNAHLIA